MTLLRYSGGRGRGPTGRGAPLSFPARGPGSRSDRQYGRSMTWTNNPRSQTPPPQVSHLTASAQSNASAPGPRARGNKVWTNTSTVGAAATRTPGCRRQGSAPKLVSVAAAGSGEMKKSTGSKHPGSRKISEQQTTVQRRFSDSRPSIPGAAAGRLTPAQTALRASHQARTPSASMFSRPNTIQSRAVSTSKAGNRVWTNQRASGASAGGRGHVRELNSAQRTSSTRTATNRASLVSPSLTARPRGAVSSQAKRRGRGGDKIQRNVVSGNLVWTNIATPTAVQATRSVTTTATAEPGPGKKRQRVNSFAAVTGISSYSRSNTPRASSQSAKISSSGSGFNAAAGSSSPLSKRAYPGSTARYSAAHVASNNAGRGRGMMAWSERRLRKEYNTWYPPSGKDLAGWTWRGPERHEARGLGRTNSVFYPAAGLRLGYASNMPVLARHAHPACRWAARRRRPWTGRERWGGQGRGVNLAGRRFRPPPPRIKARFKNKSLIRVLSVIAPSAGAAPSSGARTPDKAAAAARRIAIARRVSLVSARSVRSTKSSTPAKFIRSGKHGMAIRRVNSTDLASRRAAAASSTRSSVKTLKSASTASHTAVVQAPGPVASKTLSPAKRTTKGDMSVSRSASMAPRMPERTAALLRKSRVRSEASRKAAAVVAGARLKRARVLVRNMTLYRGKGGTADLSPSKGNAGKDASTKTARMKTEPCLFFCKFGKCSKSEDECRFVHDRSKVAVCRAFLRGSCTKGDKCLLTHAIQAEKMPVCVYFERGMCFTPNCPYLHVKVSRNAAICPKFLKGHCPDGTACRLKHELPHHSRNKGVSGRGEQGSGERSGGGKIDHVATAEGAAAASTPATPDTSSDQGKSVAPEGLAVENLAVGQATSIASSVAAAVTVDEGVGQEPRALTAEQRPLLRKRASDSGGPADENEEQEEDELKPRFLWKRRKL